MESRQIVRFAKGVLAAYGLGLAVAIVYYQWNFARDHDFMEWAFFGWVIPFLQALIWPYYLGEWLVSLIT